MKVNLEQEHLRFAKALVLFVVLFAISLGILTGCSNSGDSDASDAIEISEVDATKMVKLVDDIANMDAQDIGAEEIYTYLDSLEWVESVRYEDDGNISCRTTFGVTAVWTEESDEYISSTSSDSDESSFEEQLQIVEKFAGDGLDIVILCPYASTDGDFIIDGYKDMADRIIEEVSGSVTVLEDNDVSLASLKSLDEYDMVFFYSHGCLSSAANSAWALAESDPYTMTGEFADSSLQYVLLSSDFFYGRTVIDLSSGRIAIGGNFYTYYYEDGDMENMFFHFGSCNSMHTPTISDALLSLGAAWVEGWSDTVTFNNDFMHMYGMGACLLSGYSAEESVRLILSDENVQEYAQDDCEFVTAGDGTYQITAKSSPSMLDSHVDLVEYIGTDLSEFVTKFDLEYEDPSGGESGGFGPSGWGNDFVFVWNIFDETIYGVEIRGKCEYTILGIEYGMSYSDVYNFMISEGMVYEGVVDPYVVGFSSEDGLFITVSPEISPENGSDTSWSSPENNNPIISVTAINTNNLLRSEGQNKADVLSEEDALAIAEEKSGFYNGQVENDTYETMVWPVGQTEFHGMISYAFQIRRINRTIEGAQFTQLVETVYVDVETGKAYWEAPIPGEWGEFDS